MPIQIPLEKWSGKVKEVTIGATKANNFIYFIPLFTLAESAAFLAEPLTPCALAGAALIFAGVFVTARGGPTRGPTEKGR